MGINYKELYSLQDRVLNIVFSFEHDFYLTGGTCLSRFYYPKRFSDDLDFFVYNSNSFFADIKYINELLSKEFYIKKDFENRDFVRFIVENVLQVDFVNDRVYRYGKSIILDNGYRIDNIQNILANKITAIMGRDNPKDIFDLYLIDKYENIDWKDILEVAKKKSHFQKDELVVRLKTFPLEWINNIVLSDKNFINDFEKNYHHLINKILKS